MKKHLIAAAVAAAVAAPAFAQTSVSFFGRLDVGYANNTSDGGTAATKVKNSGIHSGALTTSRFGFNVSEDLGGGLKAIATMETELNPTATTFSSLNNRQTFVGLTGGFGGVRLGRQYTPSHLIATGYDPLGGANIAGSTQIRVAEQQPGANQPAVFAASTANYY